MKRYGVYLLIFVGVFLVTLAAIVKFAVAPKAVKAPLAIDAKYTNVLASGSNFNYFDSAQGKNVRIKLWITRTIIGDVAAGTGSVTVFDESLCLTIDNGSHPGCVPKGDPRLITNSTDRVAFDRKSAMAVDDPKFGANVDGSTAIKHVGLSYKFPIDTGKRSYPYFDTVVGKPFPMRYDGTDKIEGLTVYRFVQKMVDQPVYTNNTFPSTYTNTRTVWVEPTTGVIVKGQEELKQVLTGRASLDPNSQIVEPKLAGIVALQGKLAFTPETTKLQAQLAKDNLPKIHLVRLWLPLIALIIGLIALAIAVLLIWRARRQPTGGAADFEPRGPEPDEDPDFAEPPVWAGTSQT